MRTKINKKSDFDFIVLSSEGNPISFPTDDFSLFVWTWGSKCRFKASSIKGVLTGCKNEDNKLRVFVDNPGFVPGKLVGELVTYITNDTYDDGSQRTCRYISDFGIDMVNEDSQTNEVQVLAMMQYIQGASAYEIACEHGYQGTEEEWLATLSLESRTAANECRELMAEFTADENVRETNEAARKAAETSREETFATYASTLAAKEDTANKVTSLGADATDVQYPSAKAVRDAVDISSKNDSFVVYPYRDKFFTVLITPSVAQIRFTGLNIKYLGEVLEKTIEAVLQEIGQTTDYIELTGGRGLFFNTSTRTFKVIAKEEATADDVCLVLYQGEILCYVHPSLAYFVYSKYDYKIVVNSNSTIRTDGNKVYINPGGFGIYISNRAYYVASVDTTRTEDYEFDLGTTNDPHRFLVLDLCKIKNSGERTELADVVSVKTGYVNQTDVVIAYCYSSTLKIGVKLVGQFADIYGVCNSESSDNTELSYSTINNDILFSPEFYAYKHGRRNNSNGVGTGWYERFRLIHISDTHQHNTLYKEALDVAKSKVNAVVNTGDDAEGISTTDADLVKSQLNDAVATINSANSLPYIQVPGNHDVPGLTKQDYFSRICNVVSKFSPAVVWGDAENYRAYGYIDFTSSSYEGNFRIIMLDPFDYADGQFENGYAWQAAVFSQKQISWLIDVLTDAANKGLNVLTAMHYSFGDNSLNFNENLAKPDATYYQDAFMIPDIIDAIQHQSVLQKNYPDSAGLNNITINKDFSSVPKLKYVAHLFGHIHSKNYYRCQKTDGSKKYDMLMLGEAALGTYGNALNKAYRESGTINEIAFSALEIDVVEQTIYRVSYGSYLNYDKSNNERTVKLNYRFND